jgi:hypothetical protein
MRQLSFWGYFCHFLNPYEIREIFYHGLDWRGSQKWWKGAIFFRFFRFNGPFYNPKKLRY